jgi:hypothetical protein
MRTFFCLISILFILLISGTIDQVMTQEPLIKLTAENKSLGNILDDITRETGYHFNLDHEWKGHLVSATIDNLPLERGLKRLLRSLNYTIVWESDRLITIKIFGKVDAKRPRPASPPPLAPRTYQEEPETIVEQETPPADESDTAEEGDVEESGEGETDDATPEPVEEETTPPNSPEEPPDITVE